MKILVTGNLGYIGSVLTPMLVERGHEVVGLDVDFYNDCAFGENNFEVPTIHKDIRDVMLPDLRGFEAIVHLAALSNDPLGNLDPKLTYDINYKASVRMACLAKRAGIERFVFSSSCSVYGASDSKLLDESARFNPVTPYGKSKVMVEQDVKRLADANFSPVFLRNATVYGLSPRLRFDLVVNNLVAWAHTTGKIKMKSDGSPWRPLAYIRDVCKAFAAVLEAPREVVHKKSFNVGKTSDNVQIRDVANTVAEIVPGCEVAFADEVCADKRCYKVNCDLLPSTLSSFEPSGTIKQAAMELYEAYKDFGVTLEEFEGPRYQRIGHIKKLLAEGVLNSNLRFHDVVAHL